jgi:hypothetical protein
VTVAASPSPLARAWSARWPFAAELVLFLVLNVTYEWLRDLVAMEDITRPLLHAGQIIDAEEALGLVVEPDIHAWVQSVGPAKFLTTWFYTLAHTAGFVAMFLWVWFFRREHFAVFRNWFWLSNGVAVVGYWLYPLAPPRLSGIAAFADPTKESLELGGALSWFQPFRNEFAAMPSMHVGYTLLFALTLVMMLDSPWRWLALLWPATMLYVVMATANHWWLDGVGGACAVLIALAIVSRISGSWMLRPWQRAEGR